MSRYLIGLASLVLLCSAWANSAEEAIRGQDQYSLRDWYYRHTETGDHIRISHHDPDKPEGQRWVLDSIDGRNPTASEQSKFGIEKADKERKKKAALTELIDISTLEPLDKDAQSRRWRFSPRNIPNAKFDLSNCVGELTLNADGQITSVDIRLPSPTRFMMVAKIEQFVIHMDFTRQGNANLPSQLSLDMVGSVLGQDLKQIKHERYDEFRPKQS